MNITELLYKCQKVVEGAFDDLSKFDFPGVYILSDENDEIVYIGSSYARSIEKRLNQYLRSKDSGNTLGKTIAKTLVAPKNYDKEAESKMDDAINIIKSLKIYAIKHNDLEYKLVSIAQPKYNNYGKEED